MELNGNLDEQANLVPDEEDTDIKPPRSEELQFHRIRERVAAGIMITMGCYVNLAMVSKGQSFLGSVLFSTGLLTVVLYKLRLFTGICGNLFHKDRFHVTMVDLIFTWAFNMIGCFIAGWLFTHKGGLPIGLSYLTLSNGIISEKLKVPTVMLINRAIFCGMLMYLGVNTYKQEKLPDIARVLTVFLAVIVFIMCGFEHCIADMGYLFLSNYNVSDGILKIILPVTMGNLFGGVFMNLLLGHNR